ncbi:MAG: drug/metabolite transporter (DMT)-like permease [Oceanospirillaceae bacterium]|jgi:drug/metabolite transporter (DMT)-like permease
MSRSITKVIPLLFVWLWSTGFLGAKYGLPYIEPFFMLAVRFGAAIVIFYAISLFIKKSGCKPKQALVQILIGTLLHGTYLGGVFLAIKLQIPAGLTAIIVGLQPILTSFIAWIWLQQKLNILQLNGLILGFTGVGAVIIDSRNFLAEPLNPLGIGACLLALCGISLATVMQKKFAKDIPLLSGSMFQYVGAVLVVLPISFYFEQQSVIFNPALIGAMLWLIFGLSIAAVLLLMYMIREGEVARVTSYFYLVPPVAVFQAWWLFDEQFGYITLLGGLCSVIGVYLVTKSTTVIRQQKISPST